VFDSPRERASIVTDRAKEQRRERLPERRLVRERVRLLRKLRWMGMETEAEQLARDLRNASPEDCVLAAPRDTD